VLFSGHTSLPYDIDNIQPTFRDYSLLEQRFEESLLSLNPADFPVLDQVIGDLTGLSVEIVFYIHSI
jgi:hypothetical protein